MFNLWNFERHMSRHDSKNVIITSSPLRNGRSRQIESRLDLSVPLIDTDLCNYDEFEKLQRKTPGNRE